MRAYVCVYRHPVPRPIDRRRTEEAAADNEFLRRYLDLYDQPDCYYDWGDDPSFYSATEILDDVGRTTWGVCRRDVRSWLRTGSYVVFVCGRESAPRIWDYFYIGLTTMGQPLTREQIWSDPTFAVYRRFLNVLARIGPDGRATQLEYIHRFHPDWEERITAPYWLFDENLTALDVETPLHVATYDGRQYRGRIGGLEVWRESDPKVKRLRSLLLRGAPATRRLRTTNAHRAHTPLSLRHGYPTDEKLIELRTTLLTEFS